jgi:hypothetical protein
MPARRILIAAMLCCMAGAGSRAQDIPLSRGASDFNSVEYFEPPHEQQIRSRISGAEAQPMDGGLLLIKQARLERYDETGKLQFTANAPECFYDPNNGIANSPGEVHMQTGDNQLRIDGHGFSWRQSDSFFTISNRVETVIQKVPANAP